MTKREAEFLERLIRDEYHTVLSWMSDDGCESSLWDWQQSCRAHRRERRSEQVQANRTRWARDTALYEEINGCGKSYDNDGNPLP